MTSVRICGLATAACVSLAAVAMSTEPRAVIAQRQVASLNWSLTGLRSATILAPILTGCSDPSDESATRTPAPLSELKIKRVAGPATGGAVLDVGEVGQFDAEWTTCPTVHRDGGVYLMWYSALYDANMKQGGIGLATSRNGIRWERAKAGQPLLEPSAGGSLDNGQVFAPEVLHDGQRYLMWYTGMPIERHDSGIGYCRVFLATSRDGMNWRRANAGKPVLDLGPLGSSDSVQAATPSVLRHGDGYRMWYAAWSPELGHTICVARSKDAVAWQRENGGRPVLGLEPDYAYGPAVTRRGDQYIMLYMGTAHSLFGAVSLDGFHWKMLNDGQPVLQSGGRGAFDDAVVGHPFLAVEANKMRIWYTGYRQEPGGAGPWKLRIGLAEAELPRSEELEPANPPRR